MPCRIKIKQNLYDKVVSMTNEAARRDYSSARKVAKEVNDTFGTTVIEFVLELGESILQRNIYIPSSLVDEYYQNELALELKEAELLSYNDAQRAGVEYDDRYLFGVDSNDIQKLEFNLNTLNAVDNFLKAVGVDKRLVPNFLAPDGSVIKGAIAAANLIQGTVDIADQSRTSTINDSNLTDQEKSELIANFWKKVDSKMPEEAAHFWYRLLKQDSPLKKMLWESHKTALKADTLYKGKYGKLPGIKSAEDLTEEAIGQLIAEAIKRVENKNASNEDYSFFKKFLEWINSILGKYQTIEEDPFEVAAIKILTSDVSDLLSFEEYNALHNIVYPDAVLTPQSVKPIDYSIIEDLVDYRADWVEYGDNIVPEYTLRIKGDVSVFEDNVIDIIKFNTKEEMDDYVYKNFGNIHDNRQKEILQEVRDNEVFFDRLLNKTYKRKSKYLPKTLRKYYQIITTQTLRTLSDWEVSVDSFTINKKLSKDEKQMLEETTGYKNISPTLKVLPLILQKYKKNPISLSEKLKVDGIKKEESHIIETIKDLIKKENPDKKTITAEELVSEVHKFLSTNYMLGFGNETYYPNYNVTSTFNISNPQDYSSILGGSYKASASESFLESLSPERRRDVLSLVNLTNQQQDVFHNRVSLKFNDKFFHNGELYRKFDSQWHTYTPYAPSAWANLTYFYTGDVAYKDAALLHEIQNNNKEFLDSFDPASLTLDQELDLYINDLNNNLLQNLETLKLQGYAIDRQYPSALEQQSLFGNPRIGYFLLNRLDRPESVVFNDLKTLLQEQISFYDSQIEGHPSTIYKKIDKAYSNKRRIQDLKKKNKGLKGLLTPDQIKEIENIIKEINATEFRRLRAGEGPRNQIIARKTAFKDRIIGYQNILNEKIKELYGKDSPLVYLDAPAKPLPANLRQNNVTRRGQRYGNSAATLNENIDFLFIHSENKFIQDTSNEIAALKSSLVVAYGEQSSYRFNRKLIKITKEQFHTLFENFKFNQKLLEESIKIQSDLDLKEYQKKGFLNKGSGYDYFKLDGNTYTKEADMLILEERYFKNEEEISKEEFYEAFEKSGNKIPTPEELTLKVENLIKKATDKKEELDKSLATLNQDLAKSFETELGYFTPLVNFAIEKHIKQAGKETPLYFSGYDITLLTQGGSNYLTAAIYAGKDEVSIAGLNKDRFVFDGKTYIDYTGYTDKYFVVESETGAGPSIEITSQDYERAYNLASVKAIKQIKFKAAESIFGQTPESKKYYEENVERYKSALALSDRDLIVNQGGIDINTFDNKTKKEQDRLVNETRALIQKNLDYYQEKVDNSRLIKDKYTENEIDEILLKLSNYRKKSESNRKEVALQILFANGNRPLEPGAIYVALSKIPGVKLIWQPSIKGIKGNTGGYLVDLTNYNFTPEQEYAPPLYGLDEEEGISNISTLGKLEEVNYTLKAVNILNSKSGVKMFEKAAKADWPLEKTLTELQIPKEQKELILNLGKTDREEIITDLLANYSYTVEINIATDSFSRTDLWSGNENDGIPSEERNTQHYSNLTVPGGTNYTENEIATPAIVPSIKGHAQFATDKGIGWFRSDEISDDITPDYLEQAEIQKENGEISEYTYLKLLDKAVKESKQKTRRILEVQSDLFQKGRESGKLVERKAFDTNLTSVPVNAFTKYSDRLKTNFIYEKIDDQWYVTTPDGKFEVPEETALEDYNKSLQDNQGNTTDNQFLQLLNKDNNWVTFFVKSIIQDSAKKGYEKVLFPSGNTASKVEGHTTLEEFKKQKEDRIKELEKAKQKRFDEIPYVNDELIKTTQKLIDKNIGNREENIKRLVEYKKQKEAGVDVSDLDNEINQLKQELERVEREGFGALKPIYNFYENTVTNVLKKQGFSPKVITDEYGNTWNEVEITPEYQGDILFSTLSQNEIRRKLKEILADVTLDTEEVTSPIVEQSTKVKAPASEAVVARMQEILKVLGIKVTIGNLPVDIAAMADILNRTITFAQGQLTADNLTEEVLHFIVDIVETKYPEMFQSLMNEIIKYPTYTDVLNRYGDFSEYQRPDGSRDLYKLKKEAIAQVLVEKLLSTQNIQDKGYIDAAWNAIVRFLNKLFGQLPFQVRDSFAEMTEQIFNSDFITENDRKFLNNADFFYAAKGNRMQRELGKTKFLFGGPSEKGLSRTSTPYEVWSYIKSRSTRLDKVNQIETNADGEQEEVEYYETNTGIKQRITSFLKEVSKNLYSNVDKSARAELKRQAKMQKGTQVHQTIEDIVNRLIDDQTGLLRATPEPRPENLGIEVEAYNMLEYYFTERVRSYPQGTRFLTETRVVYEEAGLAGTIDFIAISPTKAGGFTVDVLDWKTTDMKYSDYGIQKIRADISPYNQQYWRDQLELYKSSLISYGIPAANFRKTWAIPIIVEVDIKKLDKNLPLSEDNKLVTIKNMKIGALDPSNIPSEDFGTVPVGTQSAYTGSDIVDKTVANLWEIYKRIKATPYSDAQRLKKRKDLDDILAAIKELQIQKKAKKFVVLFDSSFIKYRELLKEKPKFLKTLSKEQKLMSEEQNTELNNYISDLYDAIEFLSAFDDFSSLINELYPSASLSEEGQAVIRQVKNVGYNSNDLKEKLMKQAEDVIDELGVLYDIDQVSSLDVDSHKYGKFLISLLHREERTIQLAGRMINAMVFLGQLESKKYFDPKEGRFAVVFNNFKNWANSKNISIEEAYKKLFRREVLEFVYRGKTYSKKKDKFLKDGKEIEGSVFFDTMYSNKSKIKVTKYGREESLIPMIDSTFFDVLEEKRKEMNERLEFIIDELSTKRLTGKAKMSAAKSVYTKEILPFLEENFDLDAYKTAYKEAYDKFVQSAKVISFDPDPVIDVTKRERFIDDWIAAHDVFTSPRALSDRNWLLKINESKWISPEYRVLSQKGNEPLLEVYKLFTEINQRALKAGMLTNTSSPLKFLPLSEDATFLKALKLTAKDFKNSENKLRITLQGLGTVVAGTGVGLVLGPAVGTTAALGLAGYWLNKSIKAKFEELTAPPKEGKYIKEASAITGSVKRERKILFKNVENEEYLSKDLFRNYALWADHVIKFEVVSAFEERFEMLQLVERKKERVISTDVFGNIAYATTATGITDLSRKATETKRSTTQADLSNFIDNYLYETSLEYKPPYYKLFMYLKDAAGATYLGLRPTLWIANLLGGSSSGGLLQGTKFRPGDFEKSMASTFGMKGATKATVGVATGAAVAAISPFSPILAGTVAGAVFAKTAGTKLADMIFNDSEFERKKNFLYNLLGTRIKSEYDKEEFDVFKNASTKLNSNLLYSGFRSTDEWLQDGVAGALLMNTTIIDGKVVNIVEYVKKKYEKERFQTKLAQQASVTNKAKLAKKNREVEEKIDREISDMVKNKSIFSLLKPKGDSYTINGLDINSIEGQNELLKLSNTVHSYIKTAIGNIDENDKSTGKLIWWSTFVYQFKNFIPRVYGSRLAGLESDYERNEVTLGRYAAFGSAFVNAPSVIIRESLKNLLPLLAYANPTAIASGAALVAGTAASKYTQKQVKYNIDLQQAAKDKYQEEMIKWEAQGKDMAKFPTEAEYIDLYLNGVTNTLKAIQQVAFVAGMGYLIMSMAGGDDDKKAIMRLLARLLFSLDKELGADKNPIELAKVTEKLIPVVGYLTDIQKVLKDFGGEVVAEIEHSVTRSERSRANMEKYHPYHRFMNVLPGLRELHFWLLSESKGYAEFSEVPQPQSTLK